MTISSGRPCRRMAFLNILQRIPAVAPLRDGDLEDLALVIARAPEVVPLTVGLHEQFVDLPVPGREGS